MRPLTTKAVVDALYTFKDTTAQGADALGPRAYKLLPTEAIDELTALLQSCRDKRAWPWQVLFKAMVLLDKARCGCRTVGLLQFPIRIGMRTFPPATRQWCREYAEHWDHALSGSSAPCSAVINALRVEIGEANNEQ